MKTFNKAIRQADEVKELREKTMMITGDYPEDDLNVGKVITYFLWIFAVVILVGTILIATLDLSNLSKWFLR